MATNEQHLEELTRQTHRIVHALFSHLFTEHKTKCSVLEDISEKLKALSSRDSSAGAPEIELCVTCKQRPCGCKPAKCEHEANHVVSGYVSQNDITCVICSRCSTVGKRFDGGRIEWWPASGDERAKIVVNELRDWFIKKGFLSTGTVVEAISAKLRELSA